MGSVKPFIYNNKNTSKNITCTVLVYKICMSAYFYLPIKYTVHAVTCVNVYSLIKCIHELTQPCIQTKLYIHINVYVIHKEQWTIHHYRNNLHNSCKISFPVNITQTQFFVPSIKLSVNYAVVYLTGAEINTK